MYTNTKGEVDFHKLLDLDVDELGKDQCETVQEVLHDARKTLEKAMLTFSRTITADYSWYTELVAMLEEAEIKGDIKLSSYTSLASAIFPLSKDILLKYLRVMRAAGWVNYATGTGFNGIINSDRVEIDMYLLCGSEHHVCCAVFGTDVTGATCKLVPMSRRTVVETKEVVEYKMVCGSEELAIDEESLDG